MHEELDDFARNLKRIRGVIAGTVTADPEPRVRIVATEQRPAKEIVRDVQSLAAAGYRLSIDHRSITVTSNEADIDAARTARPVIAWINVTSELRSIRVDIGLRWAEKETTGGAVATSSVPAARMRAAVEATATALTPILDSRGARLSIESVQPSNLGGRESVIVAALLDDDGGSHPVLGAVYANDDPITSGARALLDAVNRHLVR